MAPETCNATGLWLSLEPESKIVPFIYSHGGYSTSERITHFMVIFCESFIKQNRIKTANATSKYLFTWGAKQSFLRIKLPFTVDFLCTPCRESKNDRGKCPMQSLQVDIYTMWINCTIDMQRKWTLSYVRKSNKHDIASSYLKPVGSQPKSK